MSEEELQKLERNLEQRGVEPYGYRWLIAEVRRLRAALAVYADLKHWGSVNRRVFVAQQGDGRLFEDPWTIAQKALKPKE